MRVVEETEARFSMLETIREFALEKLKESGEVEEIRRAHAEYFGGLAEEAEPHLVGRDQKEWLDRLEGEHDNFRASLTWRLAHDGQGAAALAGALWRFWDIRGYFSEGRSWLEEALKQVDVSAAELVARVLRGIASLAEAQDDYEYAVAREQEALRLYRGLKQGREVIGSLGALGALAFRQGDLPRARKLCQEAVESARKEDDKWALGRALINLAHVLADEDDAATAASAYEEALALQRNLRDDRGAATTLLSLGELAIFRGDAAQASPLLEEAVGLARRLGDLYATCAALTNLGLALLHKKQTSRARRCLREALSIAQKIGSTYAVACVLEALGCVAIIDERVHRAAALFGAAQRLRDDGHFPRTSAEKHFYQSFIGRVREMAEDKEWDKGWEQGFAMTPTDAAALAHEFING